MTDRRFAGHELESRLRALAAEIDYPATPDIAAKIRSRLETSPLPRRSWNIARSRWQPALVTIAIAAIAFASILTVSPAARDAIADFVGLDDVRIDFDDPPSPSISAPAPDLDLGRPVSMAEAERDVGFDVRVPTLGGLGGYATYVTRPPESGMVLLHYPEAYGSSDPPGLLITQFEAGLAGDFFKKLSVEDAIVEYLTVRGREGYWIEGSHLFYYFDASQDLRTEELRLAENVLLWEEDGVVYRIEGGFDRDEALRIAATIPD